LRSLMRVQAVSARANVLGYGLSLTTLWYEFVFLINH
jgi:hypothetical protein